MIVFVADPDHKLIKKDDFAQHMALLRSDMEEGFKMEYESLDMPEWEFTQYNAKVIANKNKNRYINIIPCMLQSQYNCDTILHMFIRR